MSFQTSLFKFPEEPKAILREIRNFLAGRAVGITRDEALLEEVIKVLFCLKSSFLQSNSLREDEVENAILYDGPRNLYSTIRLN